MVFPVVSNPEEAEHHLLRDHPSQGIPKDTFYIGYPVSLPAEDLVQELQEPSALRLRVVGDPANLGDVIRLVGYVKFTSSKVERSVLTIQSPRIGIEFSLANSYTRLARGAFQRRPN